MQSHLAADDLRCEDGCFKEFLGEVQDNHADDLGAYRPATEQRDNGGNNEAGNQTDIRNKIEDGRHHAEDEGVVNPDQRKNHGRERTLNQRYDQRAAQVPTEHLINGADQDQRPSPDGVRQQCCKRLLDQREIFQDVKKQEWDDDSIDDLQNERREARKESQHRLEQFGEYALQFRREFLGENAPCLFGW